MSREKVFDLKADKEAIFIERPNRFTGIALLKGRGKKELIHIHDSGRLTEILEKGNRILLKKASGKRRKTRWDLIAGWHEDYWVFTNSGYHREIAEWLIKTGKIDKEVKDFRAEVKAGNSRLDFLIELKGERVWLETKGCTLKLKNFAVFPDAPTERGKKHLMELIKLKESGDRAVILFLVFVQRVKCLAPNYLTDPKFYELFYRAIQLGIKVRAYSFEYNGKALFYKGPIAICPKNSFKLN